METKRTVERINEELVLWENKEYWSTLSQTNQKEEGEDWNQ
jgi:hypothetical protein